MSTSYNWNSKLALTQSPQALLNKSSKIIFDQSNFIPAPECVQPTPELLLSIFMYMYLFFFFLWVVVVVGFACVMYLCE